MMIIYAYRHIKIDCYIHREEFTFVYIKTDSYIKNLYYKLIEKVYDDNGDNNKNNKTNIDDNNSVNNNKTNTTT